MFWVLEEAVACLHFTYELKVMLYPYINPKSRLAHQVIRRTALARG